MFIGLVARFVIETQGGTDLGLAERLFLSTEACWPFIVAVALRQTPAAGGCSSVAKVMHDLAE